MPPLRGPPGVAGETATVDQREGTRRRRGGAAEEEDALWSDVDDQNEDYVTETLYYLKLKIFHVRPLQNATTVPTIAFSTTSAQEPMDLNSIQGPKSSSPNYFHNSGEADPISLPQQISQEYWDTYRSEEVDGGDAGVSDQQVQVHGSGGPATAGVDLILGSSRQQQVSTSSADNIERVEVLELSVSNFEELTEFVRSHLQDRYCEWQLLSSANVPLTDELFYSRITSRRLPLLVFVRKTTHLFEDELGKIVAHSGQQLLDHIEQEKQKHDLHLKTVESRLQTAETDLLNLSNLFTLPPRSASARSLWLFVAVEIFILLCCAGWIVRLSAGRLAADEELVQDWGRELETSLQNLTTASDHRFAYVESVLAAQNRTLYLDVRATAAKFATAERRLNTSLANATDLADTLHAAQTAKANLTETLDVATAQLQNATQYAGRATAEISTLQIRLRASEAEILRLQSELSSARVTETDIGNRLNTSDALLNKTRASRADLQRALAASQGLIATLRGDLGFEKGKATDLEGKLAAVKAERGKLQTRLNVTASRLNETIAEEKETVDELRAKTIESAGLVRNFTVATAKERDENSAAVAALKRNFTANFAAEKRRERKTRQNLVKGSTAKLGAEERNFTMRLATEEQKDRQTQNNLNLANGLLAAAKQHVRDLQGQLQESTADASILRDSLTAARANATNLTAVVAREDGKIDDLQGRINADMGNAAALRAQLKQVQGSVEALKAELQQAEQDRSNARDEIAKLEAEVGALKRNITTNIKNGTTLTSEQPLTLAAAAAKLPNTRPTQLSVDFVARHSFIFS
eukprot:g6824.t1